MYTLYLDDSGEKQEPYVTLAGWLARKDMWTSFEEEASVYFEKAGIEYLHTVDLHHQRNAFYGWSREKVRKFSLDLFEIAGRHIPVGFAFSVFKPRFDEQKKSINLKHEKSAFAFCFKGIVSRMMEHRGIKKKLSEEGFDLSVVLEDGNKNNADVTHLFTEYKQQKPELFKCIKSLGKQDSKALQLADFFAYFERRRLVKPTTDKRYYDEMRFFLEAIDQVDVVDRYEALDFR